MRLVARFGSLTDACMIESLGGAVLGVGGEVDRDQGIGVVIEMLIVAVLPLIGIASVWRTSPGVTG